MITAGFHLSGVGSVPGSSGYTNQFPTRVITFSALWRAIEEVKPRWSVIGWVTKNLLSRAPPCFGRHVKPLVPAVFAVVSTHQSALSPRGGLWPVLLVYNS
jgi:hypothetical protein